MLDDLVRTIVSTLEGRLAESIAGASRSAPPQNMQAYELVMQARSALNYYDAATAEPLLHTARQLEPGYGPTHAWIAMVEWIKFFEDPDERHIMAALAAARQAVRIDEADSLCQSQLAFVLMFVREYALAEKHAQRAIEINSSDMGALSIHADILSRTGRAEAAIAVLDRVFKHDPFPPSYYWESRAIALLVLERFDEAIAAVLRKPQQFWWVHCYLAVCYRHLGDDHKAACAIQAARRSKPDASVEKLMRAEPYQHQRDHDRLALTLKDLGLDA